MSYLVYCYTNKYNGKKYVGITSRSIEEREQSHIYESKNKTNKCYNAPFKRAIRKYGIDSFDREILNVVDTLEDACELEKYYIEKYKSYYKYKNSNGYNATIGGELLQMPKDRVVQIDKETLEIIKIWNSVSEAEHEYGGSIYEVVDNHTKLGKDCYWFYEKYFESIKDNYKELIKLENNYICQINNNRELVAIWSSSSSASNTLNISQGNISSCCLGLRESCANFYWCFYKDYIKNNYPLHKKETNQKSVMQFDYNGKHLQTFKSLTEASKISNVLVSDISSACSLGKSAGGFLWRLEENYNGEEVIYINNNKTKVEKLDENKQLICSYDSVGEAADDVGVKYTGISRAIKEGCRSGGFYWRRVV